MMDRGAVPPRDPPGGPGPAQRAAPEDAARQAPAGTPGLGSGSSRAHAGAGRLCLRAVGRAGGLARVRLDPEGCLRGPRPAGRGRGVRRGGACAGPRPRTAGSGPGRPAGSWVELHFSSSGGAPASVSVYSGDMEKILLDAQHESGRSSSKSSHCDSPPRSQTPQDTARASEVDAHSLGEKNSSQSEEDYLERRREVESILKKNSDWIWDWSSRPENVPPKELLLRHPKRTPTLSMRNTSVMKKGGVFSAEFLKVFLPSLLLSHLLAIGLGWCPCLPRGLGLPGSSTFPGRTGQTPRAGGCWAGAGPALSLPPRQDLHRAAPDDLHQHLLTQGSPCERVWLSPPLEPAAPPPRACCAAPQPEPDARCRGRCSALPGQRRPLYVRRPSNDAGPASGLHWPIGGHGPTLLTPGLGARHRLTLEADLAARMARPVQEPGQRPASRARLSSIREKAQEPYAPPESWHQKGSRTPGPW
ncbi:BCL2/adenovirus E1B 19 kDa protein-interacting protein 3 [Galemys pyrenaicus]|uniref:BCL2/adenovirus E1B 19 kDa protein-interacting protein 3 n=1 Tax=Galemys pyrenaicus TaxID=202257 RepID=A0A8J6DQZ2_GALPY|nr:BCL2/adenovirus E1B 19 kDa protein-interacting protein 3 [Galemys pyrenaicus]